MSEDGPVWRSDIMAQINESSDPVMRALEAVSDAECAGDPHAQEAYEALEDAIAELEAAQAQLE